MQMVSDAELAEKVQLFLRSSDLKKTTNNIVIKKLEEDFGVDLSHKKSFLRHQVDRFLQTQYDVSDDDDEGDFVRNDDVSDDEDDPFDGQSQLGVKFAAHSNNNKENNNGNDGSVNHLKAVTKLKLVKPIRRNTQNNTKACLSSKLCTLSPQLQKFLGVPHMIRAEIVKFLWTYAKERKLQDPRDGKNIICDEKLRDLFGVDSISILEINKALTQHIRPRVSSKKRMKKDMPKKQGRAEDLCEDEMAEKRQKVLSGFLAPLQISDTFIKFLGTGETALTRPGAIKKIWKYIKDKRLQDPTDKKTVICDEKLKELFNVDSFLGFNVSKLLSAHFVRKSSAFHSAREDIKPPTVEKLRSHINVCEPYK